MPISIVVGGQFGSEGKGKTAFEIASRTKAALVVRVGGTNSGHTAVDTHGKTWALRQLPVSVLAPSAVAVLPPGAIIDPNIFAQEVALLGLGPEQVIVSPYATIISEEDRQTELTDGRIEGIGSTGSGTGAAIVRRINRKADEKILAGSDARLKNYLGDTTAIMRRALSRGDRIVIEGSQGYGLSLLHGGFYPKATSRDTTAGTFLGEAGLSPMDVDDVTLVIRCHPIRVAGDSGPLSGETTWAEIAKRARLPEDYCELTTATKRIRRVGTFDPNLVRRAIFANNPTRLVLNHLDYVDASVRDEGLSDRTLEFLRDVEGSLGRAVDWIGVGPAAFLERSSIPQMDRSRYLEEIAPP